MSSLIAKIHVAKKQLGLDEASLRMIYEIATGKNSLRAMDRSEYLKVIERLEQKGFKSRSQKLSKYGKKLTALWIAAYNLGIVDSKSERSLNAFARRMTGIDHTRFLHHHEDALVVIEALKKWMAREAGVNWSVNSDYKPQAQIIIAQLKILQYLEFDDDNFIKALFKLTGAFYQNPHQITDAQYIDIMNNLGQMIRKEKGHE